ncbi:MAG: tetratricopeptide repeat protein, partial [Myxococcales bacterium]
MPRPVRHEKHVRALFEEAWRALQLRDGPRARMLGEQLVNAGYSGGYEVLAAEARQRRDLPGAISILEEGVTGAPGVWPLWELLGNYYSDARRYPEALEAYE